MRSSVPPRAESKLKRADVLVGVIRQAQRRGRRVVFTNGCFDLLHAGHVTLLQRARRLGDVLIVAVNSDRSVRALKGPLRPIVKQRQRALVLAALASVDFVTIFEEPTPQRLIERLRPDVLVKGVDWGAGEVVGRESVVGRGGRVVRIPLVRGLSTSQIIRRIRGSAP